MSTDSDQQPHERPRRSGWWSGLPRCVKHGQLADRCKDCVADLHRAEGAEAERERLKSLVTSGRHLEVNLRDLANEVNDLGALLMRDDLDDTEFREAVHAMYDELFSDAYGDARTSLYEWDKRARRTGVDWWNR